MLKTISAFIVRRRRLFQLKLFFLLIFIIILLYWGVKSRAKLRSDASPNYMKLDSHVSTISIEELKKQRKSIKEENTDEFLIPVLRDYSFYEVNLFNVRSDSFSDYDDEIREDNLNIKPELGKGGLAAEVPAFQKDVAEAIIKKEAFNRLLSDMIPLNRSVPDTREAACRSETYDEDLPTMSVIIIYTNEAYSSLLRTIHSVFNRTPGKYLAEVILVDDFSDRRDLKAKLERYLSVTFPIEKIRLVKMKQRAGLIRARMIGAHLAVGDVLLFLDAHCETVDKWAEPLLQRIKDVRTAVVCPIIDVIDDKTLEFFHQNGEFFQIGGFTWSGHFTWINIPEHEALRKSEHHSPTRSPTMAGGLFAIERKYFWEIGSYDSDMQAWGGENLEISFRVWLCGGSVEIIPCSRVGHIFRDFHPYSFPNNVDSHGLNTARLVDVWMDEYKEIFFFHRKDLKVANYGDISKRLAFKERKKCKNFQWYLDNVYMEKFRMWYDAEVYGQFKNPKSQHCLDNMQHSDSNEYNLGVYPCHREIVPSQTFVLSKEHHFRRETGCATARKDRVKMVECEHLSSKDKWEYVGDRIRDRRSGKCLTYVEGLDEVVLKKCSGSDNQKWIVSHSKLGESV